MTSAVEYRLFWSLGEKDDVDEAVDNMVTEETQPFTIVEGSESLLKF